jgi:hypothetical protein
MKSKNAQKSADGKLRKTISRRSFIAKASVSIVAGPTIVSSVSLASAQGTNNAPATVTADELAPFKKIADEKGMSLVFVSQKTSLLASATEMHLDMDMVRASLKNAIERSKKSSIPNLQQKLERLLAKGTAAQQVDFVLGSGNRYMFPEDVEKLAAESEKNKFHTFGVICGSFCWLACTCLPYNQECQQRCRDIFCPS